jgi:inorganic triphosphatase YgiF
MSAAPVETELKLRVAPATMQRLATAPVFRGAAREPVQKLTAVYYDTPELDLCRNGAALRVRREGTRYIQCVKWGGGARAGLHQRNELEVELSGPQPDLSRITNTGADTLFRSPRIAADLQPVFETQFTRSRRLLVLQEGVTVEVSLDRGEIRSGDRTEPLSEVELELKRGEVPALFQLAIQIAEHASVSLENRSKAERGYALFRAIPARPVKAAPPSLAVEMSASDAFASLAWDSVRQMHANQESTLNGDDDPEYLHQMRVGLRRLRSAFSAFSRALPVAARDRVMPDLRWVGSRLGPARDWDVFMTETLPAIRGAMPAVEALDHLAVEASRRRNIAQREVRRTLRSRRYQRAMLSLACWLSAQSWREEADADQRALLDSPVRAYAQAELERRYERVRKRGRKLEELDASGRHELRIAIKKLRYSVEFFASIFDPEAARSLRSRLARLQDILGTMNDAATLQRLMADLHSDTGDVAVAHARGLLFGWSAGRADALGTELNRAWRAFRRSQTFW